MSGDVPDARSAVRVDYVSSSNASRKGALVSLIQHRAIEGFLPAMQKQEIVELAESIIDRG
jgi:hypothetical protein